MVDIANFKKESAPEDVELVITGGMADPQIIETADLAYDFLLKS